VEQTTLEQSSRAMPDPLSRRSRGVCDVIQGEATSAVTKNSWSQNNTWTWKGEVLLFITDRSILGSGRGCGANDTVEEYGTSSRMRSHPLSTRTRASKSSVPVREREFFTLRYDGQTIHIIDRSVLGSGRGCGANDRVEEFCTTSRTRRTRASKISVPMREREFLTVRYDGQTIHIIDRSILGSGRGCGANDTVDDFCEKENF